MPRRPRLTATLGALAVLAAALPASGALASRADRDQPTLIEGDQCTADELKQVTVCVGNVVLTRGSLRITGERMELRETPEGFRSATVTAAADRLATFRQRRDPTRRGIDEHFEGAAERIEFDERTETVQLIQRALWRRLENERPRDEVAGSLITYDGRTATFTVIGARDAAADGRARLILAPRTDGEPAPPVPLRPAPALAPAKK